MIELLVALVTIAIHTKDVLAPPPKPPLERWSAPVLPATTKVELRSAVGPTLRGWLYPSIMPAAPYVIFFYGSNEDVLIERNRLEWLASIGANAVCVDYRGYGFSEGEPTADGVRGDALRVFDYVQAKLAPAGSRIFVYGWSVGTQFALHVAANRAVAGVILQAPPASADAMDDASRKADVPSIARWAVRLRSDDAVRSIYQGAAEARKVTAPMLVIAGTLDTTVPSAQARQVLDAAASTSKQLVMVEGADHNTLPFKSAPASIAVVSFLR